MYVRNRQDKKVHIVIHTIPIALCTINHKLSEPAIISSIQSITIVVCHFLCFLLLGG